MCPLMLSQLPPSFFWWIFVPSAATDGSTIAVCNQLLGVEPGPGASCWPPSAARTADRLGMEPGPGWQRTRVSGSFAPAAAREFFLERDKCESANALRSAWVLKRSKKQTMKRKGPGKVRVNCTMHQIVCCALITTATLAAIISNTYTDNS